MVRGLRCSEVSAGFRGCAASGSRAPPLHPAQVATTLTVAPTPIRGQTSTHPGAWWAGPGRSGRARAGRGGAGAESRALAPRRRRAALEGAASAAAAFAAPAPHARGPERRLPDRAAAMAEDSESAASQQSLELDDQDTCGIDGDNEEETEHAKG